MHAATLLSLVDVIEVYETVGVVQREAKEGEHGEPEHSVRRNFGFTGRFGPLHELN
jgi:hypothetical protein